MVPPRHSLLLMKEWQNGYNRLRGSKLLLLCTLYSALCGAHHYRCLRMFSPEINGHSWGNVSRENALHYRSWQSWKTRTVFRVCKPFSGCNPWCALGADQPLLAGVHRCVCGVSVFIVGFARPKGCYPTFCRFNILFYQITVNQRAIIFEEELIFQIILLLQITCVNKAVLYCTGTVAKQAGSSVLSSRR